MWCSREDLTVVYYNLWFIFAAVGSDSYANIVLTKVNADIVGTLLKIGSTGCQTGL